ncbi:hypothetical protein J6590_029919 [Homalodisca vitripennis]|nr:hypothetical protein J6590_029919 [Homalodisca vitripennis]
MGTNLVMSPRKKGKSSLNQPLQPNEVGGGTPLYLGWKEPLILRERIPPTSTVTSRSRITLALKTLYIFVKAIFLVPAIKMEDKDRVYFAEKQPQGMARSTTSQKTKKSELEDEEENRDYPVYP